MYRIVTGDWKSSVRALHEKQEALSLDGWIQNMDVMNGSSIPDYIKPEDMSYKISKKKTHPYLPNKRHRTEGRLPYTNLNTST